MHRIGMLFAKTSLAITIELSQSLRYLNFSTPLTLALIPTRIRDPSFAPSQGGIPSQARARTPGSRPGRIAAVPFSGVAVGAAVAAAVAVSRSGRLWPH